MSWSDELNNSSIDADKFTAPTANGGTVVEGTEYVTITTGVAADAGLLCLKTAANLSNSEFLCIKARAAAVSNNAYLLTLLDTAAPACGSAAAISPLYRISVWQDLTGAFYIAHKNAAESWRYWSELAGAWQAGSASLARTIGEFFVIQFIHDATRWKIIILDGSGSRVLAHTAWINWADTQAVSDSLFAVSGDPFNDQYTVTIEIDYVRYGDSAEIVGYYNGYDAVNNYGVGRALSWNDGVDFFHEPKAAVITAANFPGGSGVLGCKDPCCVLDDGTYYLFCSGYIAGGIHSIWMFTSADGLTYAVSGAAAKLPAGGGGLDIHGCEFPRAIKANDTWHIYYTGDEGGAVSSKINYCSMLDPTEAAYTKSGALLGLGAGGSFDETAIMPTDVKYDPVLKKIRLYYGGENSTSFFKVGVASSDSFDSGFTKDAANPILSYSTLSTAVSARTGRQLTVATSSGWTAGQWAIFINALDQNPEMTRVETVDDGTHVTLSNVVSNSTGKLKSVYFNKIFGANIRKISDADWELCIVGFGQKDDKSFTVEASGHAVGTDYKTFTLAEGKTVPVLPLGKVTTWNAMSAENLIHLKTPVTIGSSLLSDMRGINRRIFAGV